MTSLWKEALLGLWLAAYGAMNLLYKCGRLAKDYHRDVLALGAIALATVGFFWPILFTETWMPSGGGDLVSFLYPNYRFAAQSLRRGIIPLWNPHLYSGAPFAADNQSGLFYPINLLFFLLTPELTYQTMELMAVFHFFLAGAFMYICLRNLQTYEFTNLRRYAALLGAIAFMFSDLFVTHFGNLNMIAVAAWLPLIFLCYHRAVAEQRPALAAAAGAFLGMASLAGHIQITLFIALALALYAAYQSWAWRNAGQWVIRPFACLLTCLLIAFCFAALAFIPSWEMASHTVRAEMSYQEASRYSLPPAGLVGLLVPGLFGRGPGGFWGPWDRVEVGYIGVLTLVLAALAVILRRDGLTRFFLGLAVISLLLALGGYAILHGWLYLMPGFDKLRAPARFVYLMDFALAALAALGLDALLRPLRPSPRAAFRRLLGFAPWIWLGIALIGLPLGYHAVLTAQGKDPTVLRRTVAATGGLVFFLLMLGASLALLHMRRYRWVRRDTLGLLAVAILFVDLASLGAYTDLEPNDPTVGFRHPEAVQFLKSDPSYFRLDTRTGVWDVWQPNLSLLYGIDDVSGIWNPLELADYRRYWDAMALRGLRSSRLYDFLNAKYLVGHKDVELDWEKFVCVFDGDPQVNIYLNTKALPRALLVHRAIAVPDHESAFAAICEPDFDPASAVVVEGGKPLDIRPVEGVSSLDIVAYSPSRIDLKAQMPAQGYLVLSEVYYPGWRAYVDGRRVPVLRANYAFRAVYLEPGYHEVSFVFEPTSWKVGLGISVATWIGLAAWTLLGAEACFVKGLSKLKRPFHR